MPGPVPTARLAFPEDFVQQARPEVRHRTAPYRTVQRFRLALLLHEQPGLGHEEAGRHVGLSGRQVQRWRDRWAAGNFSVQAAPGRGRPATFSPAGPRPRQGGGL